MIARASCGSPLHHLHSVTQVDEETPWGPGEVAGALLELDMEAWALVPQGRGHEGKEAGRLPSMELALGSMATAGMLAAPGANGAAENITQWQEASSSRCQSHSFPKMPTWCCR